MIAIIGLGNPGIKYNKTRHNIGFLVIKKFSQDKLKLQKKFEAKTSSFIMNGQKIVLALPQTFMNNSGRAVSKITKYYKIKPADIWVVHDDIDLPLGTIRISQGSSSAGHKGVESIITQLGTKGFVRFRIGISGQEKNTISTQGFVLQKFTAQEKDKVKEIIEKTITALDQALQDDIEKTKNNFN